MIGAAVQRSKPLSAEGLRERLFTLAFSNLVMRKSGRPCVIWRLWRLIATVVLSP